MGAKQRQRKPIIFGSCRGVLQTVIMLCFAANLVFARKEEESEFCKRGWSEFVKDNVHWEKKCLNESIISTSSCCKKTKKYFEERYKNYITLCPIFGKISIIIGIQKSCIF